MLFGVPHDNANDNFLRRFTEKLENRFPCHDLAL